MAYYLIISMIKRLTKEEKSYLKSLGARIKGLRKQRKMTQKEMAEKFGTHYTQIGRIERGDVNSTIVVLRKVASVFGIEVSEILEF